MLLYSLLLLLAGAVADARLMDGRKVAGELKSLDADEVTLTIDGDEQTFPRSELQSLRFTPSGKRKRAAAYVQFVDDSVMPANDVSLLDGTLTVSSVGADSADSTTPSLSTTIGTLRAVRWLAAGEDDATQWNEIVAKALSDDLLVIRRDASLDYVPGVLVGVNTGEDAGVGFEYAGNTLNVPFNRAAGFVLARKTQELPDPRLQLTTINGAQWALESAKLRDGELEIVSVAGVSHRIPISQVTRIEFPQLDAVFLSDLEPASISFTPFIGTTELKSALAEFNKPQIDQSFDGRELTLANVASVSGSKTFRRGLAIRSRTEIVYRLAGEYRRFQSTAGVDPSAVALVNVELSVLGDGQTLWKSKLTKKSAPVQIDVDVANTKRLMLLVDYGENMDMGDRVHLGDARLTK